MTPNILISNSEYDLEQKFGQEFIAHIDGIKATTLRQFYEAIAEVLEIPDFGFSLESLNDALNDLSWLEDERIVLYITNSGQLLSKERDPAKLLSVLNMLDATAEDWKWVNDEELDNAKEIIVVFDDSPRIRQLLEQESIDVKLLSQITS
ncbi:barstar family protein [Spirosoma montaniterrae]|uniref:Barnase inhibitor n=1 Tax=Spirosoma montaniterrae TaxID=1178516 RepID=A0A1P9X1J4_9BACT|nr:barstar family protein [Spirosoma montaniterrae]AQG81465.1 barnase inhibitor [Spirosoma montaniterrae]